MRKIASFTSLSIKRLLGFIQFTQHVTRTGRDLVSLEKFLGPVDIFLQNSEHFNNYVFYSVVCRTYAYAKIYLFFKP